MGSVSPMKLSTKGRYAVHALVDLALQMRDAHRAPNDISCAPVSLFAISDRQGISQQYLEQLFAKLRRAGIVTSIRGQNGGYLLARPAQNINISEIIDAVDEQINTTRCTPEKGISCMGGTSKCLTHHLWENMEETIRNYLISLSLFDVLENKILPVANFGSVNTLAQGGVHYVS